LSFKCTITSPFNSVPKSTFFTTSVTLPKLWTSLTSAFLYLSLFFFRWRAVWLLSDFGTLPFTFKLFTLFTTETFWDGTKVSFYLSMTLNWLPRWHDKKCFVCGLIKFVIDKWDRSKLVTFPFRTPRGLVTEIKLQAYKSRYLSVTLENFVQPNLQVAFISIL